MTVAEFVYTTLLRAPRLKSFVNRLILLLLPRSISINKTRVMINPLDPVISGALFFGVYEKNEIAFMQRICKAKQVVIDIGANVGLYTAIAGRKIGADGRVFAFEPEPDSFHYLQQTVSANQLQNVCLVQAAVSNQNGKARLYTSTQNRGDHRLYANQSADGHIEVDAIKLDDYCKSQGIHAVDVIKMDVQGHEGQAIQGMENLIRRSPQLIMLMEYWPAGLTAAGTRPLSLLQELEEWGLRLFEIKNQHRFVPVKDKNILIERLRGRQYTNLLLLGPQAEITP